MTSATGALQAWSTNPPFSLHFAAVIVSSVKPVMAQYTLSKLKLRKWAPYQHLIVGNFVLQEFVVNWLLWESHPRLHLCWEPGMKEESVLLQGKTMHEILDFEKLCYYIQQLWNYLL